MFLKVCVNKYVIIYKYAIICIYFYVYLYMHVYVEICKSQCKCIEQSRKMHDKLLRFVIYGAGDWGNSPGIFTLYILPFSLFLTIVVKINYILARIK